MFTGMSPVQENVKDEINGYVSPKNNRHYKQLGSERSWDLKTQKYLTVFYIKMYKLHVVYLFIVKKQETSSKTDLLDGVEDTHAGLYIMDGIFVANSLMNQQ